MWHDYFFIFFYRSCAVCEDLERWGHQVSLNDLTSHQLFATLRPRQSQSRWPSALKVAGCNEPIGTYNLVLHISDLYIDDLRSDQFLDIPIISQWEKSCGSFFTNTRCNNKLYNGWHPSWPSWPIYIDANSAMWQPWGHVTSSKVTKRLCTNSVG